MKLLPIPNERLHCADINTTWSAKGIIVMYARNKSHLSRQIQRTGFRFSNIQVINNREIEDFIKNDLITNQEWQESLKGLRKVTVVFAKEREKSEKEAVFILCTENKSHAEQIITERNSWEVIDIKSFYLDTPTKPISILNLVITSIINFLISFFK